MQQTLLALLIICASSVALNFTVFSTGDFELDVWWSGICTLIGWLTYLFLDWFNQ